VFSRLRGPWQTICSRLVYDQTVVRAATFDDVPGIARVHVASWRTTYRGIVPDAVLENLTPEGREPIWRRIVGDESQTPFVALEGDEIVGFASGGPERSNDPAFTAELYAIYLLETHQRRGLGRELVKAVVDAFKTRGHAAMLVWVLRDNPSRAFYESLGGTFLREQDIEIGGATLKEVAYGWTDIRALARHLENTV
jgi:GNAT superfamily N-acetyltransferase